MQICWSCLLDITQTGLLGKEVFIQGWSRAGPGLQRWPCQKWGGEEEVDGVGKQPRRLDKPVCL